MLVHSGRPAAAATPGARARGAHVMAGAILSVKVEPADAPVLSARGTRTRGIPRCAVEMGKSSQVP